MIEYSMIFAKLGIGLLVIIFQINIMGKGNLAPTSALDQVQNYVLGGIIGGIIYNDSIGILQFLLILIAWTILVMVLRYAKGNSNFVHKLIDGDPILVIDYGKILTDVCMRAGLNAGDLHLKLRSADVWRVEDVYRGILEQNGQLTIMKYDDRHNRYPLIADGNINESVLELIGKNKEWIEERAAEKGYKVNDIYLAEYDDNDISIYAYAKQGE